MAQFFDHWRIRPRRGRLILAAALLSTPLWMVGFGGALVGSATFGQCTGVQSGTTDVSTGGKCINTDASGAATYPYTGYIYLPAGTTAIADVFTYHTTTEGSCFTAVSGTYTLTVTDASSISHTYTYVVPQGTGCGYPTPPAGSPIVNLGFTSTGQVVSYTLTVSPDTTTYPVDINTSRNQVYYYDSQGKQTGQAATNSVKFTQPSPVGSPSPSPSPVGSPSPSPSPVGSPSPSPSPVGSPSPSPSPVGSPSPSPSPVGSPSPSPSPVGSPSPSPSPVGSPSPSPSPVGSPSPSPSPVVSPSLTPGGGNLGNQGGSGNTPSGSGAGAGGAQGLQGAQAQQVGGANVTSPNTGLDVAFRVFLSLLGVVGGLALLASTRTQRRA